MRRYGKGLGRTLAGLSLVCLLLLTALAPGVSGAADAPRVTLLFTTDIHSNDVPHLAMLEGEGVRLGGFARLKTAVDAHFAEGETLLLDSGDFSMGTLYQNYTESDALELTLMDALGYDAAALGNHDFELGEEGLHSELAGFRERGGRMAILASNLTGGDGRVAAGQNENPLNGVGVQNYTVLERGGVRVGIFALMGYDAVSYTPVSTLSFSDPVESAKAMVDRLRNVEHADLVVALSHAGTMPDGSFHEDADIAAAVDGIDVILSGHEHVPTPEAIRVNGTLIVCAGTALNYLGKLTLTRTGDGWAEEYRLIPLTNDFAEDPDMKKILAEYTDRIDSEYLFPMGVTENAMADFAVSDYDFPDGDHMCLALKNYAFGALIGDGYLDGLQKAGVTDVSAVAVPVGFVRNGLYRGNLRVMDVYNALSYGISPLDGSSGAPVCVFYLNGEELYNLCETSVSLSGVMNTVQMLLDGLRFTYSDARLILNRVYAVEAVNPATGEYEPVSRDDEKLYKVAASWTALQNLALLGDKSHGLLTLTPKDGAGVPYPAERLFETVVLRPDGGELKEWFALYGYLNDMPVNGDGLHAIDPRYGEEPTYMTEQGGAGLFFKNPGKAFWIIAAALLGMLLVLVLLALLIRKLVRRIQKARRA